VTPAGRAIVRSPVIIGLDDFRDLVSGWWEGLSVCLIGGQADAVPNP